MYSLYIVQAVCDVSFIGDSILVVHPGSLMDYSADKKTRLLTVPFRILSIFVQINGY